MQGVFLDTESLDAGDLERAALDAALPGLRYYAATARHEVVERVHDAEVVITNKVPVFAEAIAAATRLKLILVAATGTNNVDLAAAAASRVVVSNARGYGTASVVQHVFAALLALYTRLEDYRRSVAGGRWQRARQFCLLDHRIHELAGKTLGIVGHGELGRGVARMARAFDMEVLIAERPRGGHQGGGRLPLDALLTRVDVLSLHCPLADDTRGLIGARELALMGEEAVLVNTARGGIVDEAALAEALWARAIGGAIVDCLTVEPPAGGNALLAPGIPNLILTPHCAWASVEARQRLLDQLAENARAYLAGEPIRTVG